MIKQRFLRYLLFCVFAFVGCSFYEVDDESDYVPAVKGASGCWLSTENIGGERWITIESSGSRSSDYVFATPSKTCMEFCLQENSSFTFVAKLAGSDYFPSFSTELFGSVEPGSLSPLGTGGRIWTMYWSQGDVSLLADGDSTKRNYDHSNDANIRLVDGKLSGVRFYPLEVKDKHGSLSIFHESRKYSRTQDRNACDDFDKE